MADQQEIQQQQQQENQPQQQQDRLDEELVPVDDQLRIGRSNYRIALEKSQPDVIYKHIIKLDKPLGNMKFTNNYKGAKDLIFGMAIPMVMLSDEIKTSDDYLNYLAKSTGFQPVKTKGRDKGLLTKKRVEVVVKKVSIPKKRRSKIVIEETDQSDEMKSMSSEIPVSLPLTQYSGGIVIQELS
ncbi:hypothetical protein Tco_0879892 [Tanacetum coccineum]